MAEQGESRRSWIESSRDAASAARAGERGEKRE
jgi:hypothetical protein